LNRADKTYKYEYWWEKISRYTALPAILISSLLVSIINISSLLPFVYFLVVSIFLYAIIFKKVHTEVILLYGLYSLLTIILYLIQYATLPEFIGFSGGVGIGTDDCRYFIDVVNVTYYLPEHCYAHSVYGMPNYSTFISGIALFKIIHPFDILFVNVVAAVFTPLFVRGFSKSFFQDKRIAIYAFAFTLICPFILSNSLILIRDGWTATLFIGSLYLLLKKKYIILTVFIILLFYIRIASGALALVFLFVLGFYLYKNINTDKFTKPLLILLVIGTVLITGAIAAPFIVEYMVNKNIGGSLLREEFLISYYVEGGSGRDNPALIKLMSMPAIIRIPASTLFFILLPLFSPGDIIREGLFIPRSFLFGFIYPLLFLFYFKFSIQSLIFSITNKHYKIIFIISIFIIAMIILSQWSLQPRHKTMVMPLFYIIAAYGLVYKDKLGQQISTVLLVLFIIGQLFLIAVL
jgi:hypothetical protein